VVFEDSAALAGLVVAAVGIYLADTMGMPVLDGVASIVIGTILCIVALLLLRESKGLLVGESADPTILEDVRDVISRDPCVKSVGRVLTMHIGPREILLNVDLNFVQGLGSEQVTTCVDRLESRIRERHQDIRNIFIEAKSLTSV
jgi:divalent metal cation (Fe/Co/Zn/Cd) transporter